MSKFTESLVDDLADRLLIGLSREENKMVLDEFEAIDENIDLINKIEGISEVKPMTHCLDDFEFVLREDVVVESPELDELLANCDETEDGEVIVVNRGDKGAAIINFALESNGIDLATSLPDGEYTDQVYGTLFKVEEGVLKGTVAPDTTYIISVE